MLSLQPSTFEEFEREAARGNVVPVVRVVLADLLTPLGALLRVAGAEPYAFLLESVEGGERVARYSFLGAKPEMIVRGRGDETIVERGGGAEVFANTRAIDFLREHFRGSRLAAREGLSPFTGGAVGFLGYEAVRWFEPALDDAGEFEADDAVFMIFRSLLAFDRVRQQIEISSLVMTDEAGGDRARLRSLYDAAVGETERIEELLLGEPSEARVRGEGDVERARRAGAGVPRFESNWEQSRFERAVEEIKERIFAGDCYQAVLSQRFAAEVTASPLEIYRALRALNPSPYMFFLRLGELSVVGASPEMLVRCRGRELEYRPIAGTRPRGATEAEDAALAAEMRADEKEVAEHLMLVDLGRNDLGRVAEYGTVRVGELMSVERYSHVQHLVTSLTARLREGADRFDALAACFPAGTVTGAPKVSAMRIIRALEPAPRGVYAGSVLYLDYAENLDSCIAIRTLVLRGSRAEAQAGAGIVADSAPAREHEECVNKARALLRAVELAERGL
ncbi:MAG: anthranilate synthase component I family protein [Acidobacteria bacterium]|nr:anthranilate synthase component I family protein [Acidobacteriota bacterium]MCA1642852.1 anthranilate synthase component I family protein [Acidobacteriota bacterium]